MIHWLSTGITRATVMSNETVQQAENICLNSACIHMTHAREPSYKSYAYGSGQKLSPEGSYWFFNLSRGVEQNPPPLRYEGLSKNIFTFCQQHFHIHFLGIYLKVLVWVVGGPKNGVQRTGGIKKAKQHYLSSGDNFWPLLYTYPNWNLWKYYDIYG